MTGTGTGTGTGEGMLEIYDATVTLVHSDGKTTVTVSHVGYGASADHAGLGWKQAFDKLTAELAQGKDLSLDKWSTIGKGRALRGFFIVFLRDFPFSPANRRDFGVKIV